MTRRHRQGFWILWAVLSCISSSSASNLSNRLWQELNKASGQTARDFSSAHGHQKTAKQQVWDTNEEESGEENWKEDQITTGQAALQKQARFGQNGSKTISIPHVNKKKSYKAPRKRQR